MGVFRHWLSNFWLPSSISKRYVLFYSILLCIVSLLLFVLSPKPGEIRFHFTGQFFFAVIVFFTMSVLLVFTNSNLIKILVLILKAGILIPVGIPLGRDLLIEFFLTSILILEIVVYIHEPYNLIGSIFSIFIFGSVQHNFVVWKVKLPAPENQSIYTFSVLLLLFLLFGFILNRAMKKMVYFMQRSKELEGTIQNLIEANKSFQEYAITAREIAELEERKRISREIHNTIGYTLTNLIVMMESAIDFTRSDLTRTELLLDKARTIAEKGLEDIRFSLRLLRHVDDKNLGGVRAIQRMVDTFSQNTGIKILTEYGNIPWSFGQQIDAAIYNIVQESIINSLRHGHATEIKISFWKSSVDVQMEVTDNGVGAKNVHYGIGLSGMKERISALEGDFDVKSRSGSFEIQVKIPLLPRSGYEDD